MILGVDAFMDMARTLGQRPRNCLASVVVARWENEFDPSKRKGNLETQRLIERPGRMPQSWSIFNAAEKRSGSWAKGSMGR